MKLWHRICTLPATRITRKVFDWLSSWVSTGKGNWVSGTHQLLHSIDLPLNSVTCNNRRHIADLAWDSLAAIYTDKWEKEVWDIKTVQSISGGCLSVYRVFKSNPGTENYVIEHLPVNVQRVVAGLRMGCLPLKVETGKYTGTPMSLGSANSANLPQKIKNTSS